ncbi:MAG: RagB/SusD family nutrient uptake outer membrane protein [Bacteroidales bacterium]|nr:RagB/SusD family nutrient uptake outer membrane protein [Bacteroidales bacterium]
MKRILYMALSAMAFTSCDFLDTEMYGNMNVGNLYHDEASCNAGLMGVYDKLQATGAYGQNLWADLDAGTDILVYNRGYGANDPKVCLYNYNNTLQTLEQTWKDLYEGINRANDYIELIGQRTEGDCGGKANRDMFMAEAKALRALYYMNLAAFWGDVPLRLEPSRDLDVQQRKRSPQKEVYAQIIKDLTDAEKGCLDADVLNSPGRISRTTVQALLARAYMWQSGYPVYADTWSEALHWAREVKKSGLHQLYRDEDGMNGYCALFRNMCSDRYDLDWRESMFEVEFYGNGVTDKTNESGKVGLYLGVTQMLATDPDVPYAYGWYDGTKILFRLYDEENDARKWWNFADYSYQTVDNKAVEKPVDKTSKIDGNPGKWRAKYDPVRPWARNNSSINFPVMRYSDVLLMIAECANEVDGVTQEAVDALNEVRARAGASLKSVSDFAGKGEFRAFVRDERTRELCFEVPRRMELRRFGEEYFLQRVRLLADTDNKDDKGKEIGYMPDNNKSLPGRNILRKHIWFPIPQVELNTNPACGQNENW